METKVLEIAEKLVIASKRAYNRGIQTGSGGNVSARIPGTETMLVKASGGSLGDCTLEGFLITDFDGKFSIKANNNATLIISYIGYKNQEIKIKGTKNLNIKMEPDNAMLDEVIVVGYGSMKKAT